MFKNFFIPNPSNNYYPISIRPRFMYTYLVFMLIFNLFASHYLTNFAVSPVEAQTTYSSEDIINLTNQDRQTANVALLNENTDLDNAAAAKAADMFQYDYWAHYNPVTGASPWDFITKSGYDYEAAGENLAEGFSTAQDVNTAWVNSPDHYANIINPDFKDIGVAVSYGQLQGSYVILVVEEFGELAQAPVIPTPHAAPTPQALGTSTTPTPKPVVHPSHISSTPTAVVPTATPTAIATPTAVVSIPAILAPKITPTPPLTAHKVQSHTAPTPTVIQDIGTKIEGMQFANRVNFVVALFLLIIFLLDSIYYYKVRNIHERSKANSIAHLPLLTILILICLIGTSGSIL